ncbi:MAG: hypothetical protein L3J97_08045 [Thermoplasmata archaeon]|nr:hypothetical protein [Thermoplasmata archaeon]
MPSYIDDVTIPATAASAAMGETELDIDAQLAELEKVASEILQRAPKARGLNLASPEVSTTEVVKSVVERANPPTAVGEAEPDVNPPSENLDTIISDLFNNAPNPELDTIIAGLLKGAPKKTSEGKPEEEPNEDTGH